GVDPNNTSPSNGVDTTGRFGDKNDGDHYSGVWKYKGASTSEDATIIMWRKHNLEIMDFFVYDTAGDPIWLQSQTCGDPCNTPEDEYFDGYINDNNSFGLDDGNYNFYTRPIGFNPLGYKPPVPFSGELLASAGRQFTGGSFNEFQQAQFWFNGNFTLDNNRALALSLGNENSLLTMEKYANINHIGFNIQDIYGNIQYSDSENNQLATTCDPNLVGPCTIKFNWYSDSGDDAIKAFYKTDSMSDFEPLPMTTASCIALPQDQYFVNSYKCNNLAAGTYQFELRRPSYNYTNSWITIAKPSSPLIIETCNGDCSAPPAPTIEEAPDAPVGVVNGVNHSIEAAITHQPGAGPIPGSGNVSGGSATYNLPLTVPPGRNGMTPSLSVNYSSKGGNGILGVGWSLSVGSSIYRCPQTIAQDEKSTSVNFSNTDRLCLDGQRLMLINATGDVAYWAVNAEYRTEQDSFVKVVKTSSGFTVYTKSGRINTYEQLNYNEIEQLTTWQLIKEQDTFGNNIIYSYLEYGENEILLTRINYTGHNSTTGSRVISFTYEGRLSGYEVSYNFGEKTESTKQLLRLETSIAPSNTPIRKYIFDYSASISNGDTLLSSVIENVVGVEGGQRHLLTNTWSDFIDKPWSLNTWLDNTSSKFNYKSINNTVNSQTVGTRYSALLGRAKVSHDFNGDGVKDFVATAGGGQTRSIFFFNADKELMLQVELPTPTGFGISTRIISTADLNFDGITDILDTTGLYSWKNNKQLPDVFKKVDVGTSVVEDQYFNVNFQVIANLQGKIRNFVVGENGIAFDLATIYDIDSNKTSFFISDYDHDGDQDIIAYATPDFRGRDSYNVCMPENTEGCVQAPAKLLLFENTTECGGSSDCSNTDNVSFGVGSVLIDNLAPYVDYEDESDIWMYIWDSIVAVDDFNGDGYPDIHIRRWDKVALFLEFDYKINIDKEFLYFTTMSGDTLVKSQKVDFTELGLRDFTCTDLSNSPIDCSIPIYYIGGEVRTSPLNTYKAFHFEDINVDGLKDFVYYDRGTDFQKSWKVRLNQGGGQFDSEHNFTGQIFNQDFVSDINAEANKESLVHPSDCAVNYYGEFTNTTIDKSILARKCNPYFAAVTGFRNLDSDGIPELIFPDSDATEGSNHKANNLVFNYCSTFRLLKSRRVNRTTSGAHGSTTDFEVNSKYIAVPRSASGDNAVVLTSENATDPYNLDSPSDLANCSISAISGFLECTSDDPTNELNHDIQFDPKLYNSAFYPYNEQNDDDFSLFDISEDDREALVTSYRASNTANDRIVLVHACSYNSNEYIRFDTVPATRPYDLYEDFRDMASLADRGLYKFNAIKFELAGDGVLNLTLSKDTGIVRQLRSGEIGDLTGNGITDKFGIIGCLFGSTLCQSLVSNGADDEDVLTNENNTALLSNWNVTQTQLMNFGTPILGHNSLQMPNMLIHIEKPNGQYVEWNYHPISTSNLAGRGTDFPLYQIKERNCTEQQQSTAPENCDSYVDEDTLKGLHFYFNSSMYVVSQMRTTNNYGNDAVTDYAYEEAVYNNKGRGFQGFRTIKAKSNPVADSIYETLSVSTFHQVFPYAGKLEKIEVYQLDNSSQLVRTQTEDYTYKARADNNSIYDTYGIHYHPLTSKTTQNFDLNGNNSIISESSTSALSYDDYGNTLTQINAVTSYLPEYTTTQTTTSTNIFAEPLISGANWWIDKLENTTVIKQLSGTGPNIPTGNHTTTSKFIWQAGAQRRLDCQITSLNNLANNYTCGNNINTADVSRNIFAYDQFGNITTVQAQGLENDSMQTRTVLSNYETPSYFPESITRQTENMGLTTSFSYDNATGQVLQTTDPNNNTIDNTYDAFGFKTEQELNKAEPQYAQTTYSSIANCTGVTCNQAQAILTSLLNNLKTSYTYANYPDLLIHSGTPKLTYVTEQRQNGQPQILTYYDTANNPVITKTYHSNNQFNYVVNVKSPLGITEVSTQPFSNVNNVYATIQLADAQGRIVEKITEIGELNTAMSTKCTINTLYTHTGAKTDIIAGNSQSTCAFPANVPDNLNMSRTYDTTGKLISTTDANSSTVNYWYGHSGNPYILQDAGGNQISTIFDALGRKTSVNDPNMGTKTFTYNSFGEVVQQKVTGENYSSYYQYDILGRLINQYSNVTKAGLVYQPVSGQRSYKDSYQYDTIALGQLSEVLRESNKSNNECGNNCFQQDYKKQLQYDQYARLKQEITTLQNAKTPYNAMPDAAGNDNVTFTTTYKYDSNYNRIKQVIYNSRYAIQSQYTKFGTLKKQLNSIGIDLMEITSWNHKGQETNRRFNSNNAIYSNTEYYESTGQIAKITNAATSNTEILDYQYDVWGNIYLQEMLRDVGSAYEFFTYDKLHRLTSTTGSLAVTPRNYNYNILGNITSKSDFSNNYSYGASTNAGPNAVSQATLIDSRIINYSYDVKGNRIQDCIGGNCASYKYDYNNLLIESHSSITGTPQTLEFNYGPDNQRYRKYDQANNEITLYTNKDYEQVYKSGFLQQEKYYLTSYLTITLDNNTGIDINFIQKDRLGSTTQILDEAGTVLHNKNYDAFGKPRNSDWSDMAGGLFKAKLNFDDTNGTIDITKRGFTDHEHLDEMQLIHMNGRMYDYNNGRFLSVDPFIQNPTSTQSMNPYTYIFNNPLSGTDPTGYYACKPGRAGCDEPKPKPKKKRNRKKPGSGKGFGWVTVYQSPTRNGNSSNGDNKDKKGEISSLEGQNLIAQNDTKGQRSELDDFCAQFPSYSKCSGNRANKERREFQAKLKTGVDIADEITAPDATILLGPVVAGVSKLNKARKTVKAERVLNVSKGNSKIWKGFSSANRKGLKTSGSGKNKQYYDWDFRHNDIEVYDQRGKHLGSMNPETGEIYKPAVVGRTIDL
ncbi:YD repeat protein, partial [hydrothermal vent metagenome]